jgi:hypothetical protein
LTRIETTAANAPKHGRTVTDYTELINVTELTGHELMLINITRETHLTALVDKAIQLYKMVESPVIGVVALQGAVEEHASCMLILGCKVKEVIMIK